MSGSGQKAAVESSPAIDSNRCEAVDFQSSPMLAMCRLQPNESHCSCECLGADY